PAARVGGDPGGAPCVRAAVRRTVAVGVGDAVGSARPGRAGPPAGQGARGAAWCAPAILAIPTMLEVGSSVYVEGWLLLLVALALRFALAGSLWSALFVGLALQVKYTAVAPFAFVLLLLMMDVLRRSPEEGMARAKRIPLFLVLAVAIGAPFFLRNWIERG